MKRLTTTTLLILCLLWASWASTAIILNGSQIKPPLWAIDPGIVAYNASRMGLPMPYRLWAIWEGGGSKVYDLSGNNNAGTITGATWKPGGLYFSEAAGNDKIDFGLINMASWPEFTVVAGIRWVETAQTAEYTICSNLEAGGGSASILFRVEPSNNSLEGQIVVGANLTKYQAFTNSVVYNDGRLNVAALVFDTTSLRACIDGVQDSLSVATGAVFDADNSTSNFQVGATPHAAADDYNGYIDFVYLFRTALTVAQNAIIAADPYGLVQPLPRYALWHAGVGGAPSPTVMAPYYYMNN